MRLHRAILFAALALPLALASPARAALASGVYQTVPVATVAESGDRVPNDSRIVPLFATLTLDLSANPPSMSAVITNAVLEGGDPFMLTVRSSSVQQLTNGTYRFMGDYLGDIYPQGTQYLFDWKFSVSTNGQAVWNGIIGWAGGHAWYVMISNITIVPVPSLDIAPAGTTAVRITWATNVADYVLEHATHLPATEWSSVTNAIVINGDRLSVTVDTADAARRFFRLRKP